MITSLTYRGIQRNEQGFALIAVFMFITTFSLLFSTYSFISRVEMKSLKASKDSFSGFNAAEAGLNLRADLIKNEFVNYNRPMGVSPSGVDACEDPATDGSGSFECQNHTLNSGHVATTFIQEDPLNPENIVIPLGEQFAGLIASEYKYNVTSVARNNSENKEAHLELVFKSRLIPLFQFAAFFNDDLELMFAGLTDMSGPVHSNKDIYIAQQTADWLSTPYGYYEGPISTAMDFNRGVKFQTSCNNWDERVYVEDLTGDRLLPGCSGSRFHVDDATLADYNGNITQNASEVTVPEPSTFEAFSLPDPGSPNTFTYWQRADVRFVLRLQPSGLPETSNAVTGIEVVDELGNNMVPATDRLNDAALCPGSKVTGGGAGRAVGNKGEWSDELNRLRLVRDHNVYPTINNYETVLDVDMQALLNCIHEYSSDFLGSGDLDESSDGGLVFYFAIDGPNSGASQNNYAVRYNNANILQSNIPGAPSVLGLTVVTDQKTVIWGDYNGLDSDWIPAAIITDTVHVLSDNWQDFWSRSPYEWWRRFTGTTELRVQAAVLHNNKPTCGGNGTGGCTGNISDFGSSLFGTFRYNEAFYDGKLRSTDFLADLSEDPADAPFVGSTTWTQQPFYWKGSNVSLQFAQHNQTAYFPNNYSSAPAGHWSYDERFNNPDNLPPLTPRAVYNVQELFVRDYE